MGTAHLGRPRPQALTVDTPGVVTLDRIRRDLREFARLAEVGYDPAVVDPVLEELEPLWTTSVLGVRTTTHPPARRQVNVRLMNSGPGADPVTPLRKSGLLEFTGHPMEELLVEVPAAVPALYGVDVGVTTGVEKIWLMFPELLEVDRVLEFPGIPQAARDHAAHLNRYGGQIGIMALDFASRTMNLYSRVFTPGTLTAAEIGTMLADLDFVAATDTELALLAQTFNLYRTFSWTSPRMRRICLPARFDAETFPKHLDPVLDRFVSGAPYAGTGSRAFTFYTAYGPDDRYYKVQAEYTSARTAAFPGGAEPRVHSSGRESEPEPLRD
ncbi:aromatic prenyltransferase [Nocardia terrae]|uniref:aromatic prenyltransferase n=1 Tax=Nocardia terrae TaxID=2675851 RepID=UPI0012F94D15|nr:aromatic prenyltransferase [Nocardia terrae]